MDQETKQQILKQIHLHELEKSRSRRSRQQNLPIDDAKDSSTQFVKEQNEKKCFPQSKSTNGHSWQSMSTPKVGKSVAISCLRWVLEGEDLTERQDRLNLASACLEALSPGWNSFRPSDCPNCGSSPDGHGTCGAWCHTRRSHEEPQALIDELFRRIQEWTNESRVLGRNVLFRRPRARRTQ